MGIRVIGRKSGIMQKRSILKTTTNGKMEEESLPNGRFSYWVYHITQNPHKNELIIQIYQTCMGTNQYRLAVYDRVVSPTLIMIVGSNRMRV